MVVMMAPLRNDDLGFVQGVEDLAVEGGKTSKAF
jgi:hypothetical protein